ncbi:MAG: SpoIIIAH-like family protein [Clostridia bacterium]
MMNNQQTTPFCKGTNKKDKANRIGSYMRAALLLALVITAGLLIWQKNAAPDEKTPQPKPTAQTQKAAASPMPTTGRSARELAYDKDVQTLTALIESGAEDAETRAHASARLTQMVSEHQSELGIEEALLQAGFKPCVVLLQNGALTVMVANEKLNDEQRVTILSLCAAHTDIGVENIRIMMGEEG